MSLLLFAAVVAVLSRCLVVLRKQKCLSKELGSTCSIAIFLGSGGHTSEALALVSSLDFTRYTPRVYIISEGDHLSARKAETLELSKATTQTNASSQYSLVTIPRARRVHQSLLTTVPTAVWSFLLCAYYMIITSAQGGRSICTETLLLNGPGTCVVICLTVYLRRFLGLRSPRMIYVESFARVQTLSLSGKLLYFLVDKFIVQWPQLLQACPRGECRGCLV